jgi:hypothetical protein
MSDMDKSQRHIAFCPNCGNTAPQRVVHSHRYFTKWYGTDGKPGDHCGPECEAILCVCETCNEALLYDGVSESESGAWPSLKYPLSPELHRSVPSTVRSVYAEASRIKALAPNAFAVMIRRALEAICDDRQVKEGTLAQRLKELVASGHLPPTIAEVTDVLRILGNAGAHASDRPVTVPQTWAIDEFFRVVVEYVYVAPSKLAEFRKTLNRANASSTPD